jgi:hypothetical protein
MTINQPFSICLSRDKTPAEGLLTLFITGLQSAESITDAVCNTNVSHLHFGKSHSFNPKSRIDWHSWENTIIGFLKLGYMCSLDIHHTEIAEFNEGGLNEYDNFIPIIHVELPYIRLWNYNTVVKITDSFAGTSNPGVWSHSLHDLKDRNNFTPSIKIK